MDATEIVLQNQVLIPVMDRYARGYPEFTDGEPAVYGPLAAALTTSFDWDAHLAAYSQPNVPRRLAKEGALALGAQMVLFVVDVEPEGHTTPTPEWWDAEIEKWNALLAQIPGGYIYATRGGYRLIYRIEPFKVASERDAAVWRASYLAWLDDLRETVGIIGDRACADWTRLYRLPRVVRDGERQVPEEIGIPTAIGVWPAYRVEPAYVPVATPQQMTEAKPASPELKVRARQLLVEHGPAVTGGGGNMHTRAAWGLLVHNLALPVDEARELIREWNQTCQPPWNETELFSGPARDGQSWNGEYGGWRAAFELGFMLRKPRSPDNTVVVKKKQSHQDRLEQHQKWIYR